MRAKSIHREHNFLTHRRTLPVHLLPQVRGEGQQASWGMGWPGRGGRWAEQLSARSPAAGWESRQRNFRVSGCRGFHGRRSYGRGPGAAASRRRRQWTGGAAAAEDGGGADGGGAGVGNGGGRWSSSSGAASTTERRLAARTGNRRPRPGAIRRGH